MVNGSGLTEGEMVTTSPTRDVLGVWAPVSRGGLGAGGATSGELLGRVEYVVTRVRPR